MTEEEKARRYVLACGSPEKALIAIDILIAELHKSYPKDYDYKITKNYQSVMMVREEIKRIKSFNIYK